MQFGGLLIFVAVMIAVVGSVKQNGKQLILIKFQHLLAVYYPSFVLYTDLIIAVGDQLEVLIDGSTYQTLTLDSYNASKFSALAYDATTGRLFFSDIRHLHGHIFGVSLTDGTRRSVEDIVESIILLTHE